MSTNFPGGATSQGLPVGGVPVTFGNRIYVDANGNGGDGSSMEEAQTSLATAYASAITNNDDVILLSSYGTHTLSAMLDVSKNRVHFVGVDGTGRYYGQGAKVSLGVTTAATDIATMKNTGVRNSFVNIKFMNSNTVAEGIYCVAEGGEYAYYENVEIYKSTDLDVTGAAELLQNGDSPYFKNCTIGSLADVLSGDVIHANILLTRVLSGKVSRDAMFENCLVWRRGSNVNNRLVYAAADADVERLVMFKNTAFIKAANSAAVPAQAIGTGASLTVGLIYCDPLCTTNCTKMSAATGVFVSSPVPTAATSGIVVNAA